MLRIKNGASDIPVKNSPYSTNFTMHWRNNQYQ